MWQRSLKKLSCSNPLRQRSPAMQASIDRFDALLQRSDSDSLAWADGGDSEEAAAMLAALPMEAWSQLQVLCPSRDATWRACLVSVLSPQQGEQAGDLLLRLAADQDIEVASLAVRAIAFHCGINVSAHGPFIDPSICNADFVVRAKAAEGLADQVRRVGSACAPGIQRQFDLLASQLDS